MDRLSPLDSSFLHVEDANSHMHIGSVAIFEGPPPAYDDVRAQVESKLALVPRYRQKVRFVPLALGRPLWVDDPHFNAAYHLRHTALPPPGGDHELRNLTGRVMSQQLDRAKPLWEMWMVEGLGAGRWALLSKVHHCMVDGVSGTDLLTVILDTKRDPTPGPADGWQPRPEPTRLQVLAETVVERALSPYEGMRTVRAATRAPRQLATLAWETAQGLAAMRSLVRAGESSLNGPIGPHRRWDWARAQLSDVKTVRTALGGTVNDVVLAVITNGFRELLHSRGEPVKERGVRTLVPVSVRSPSERGTYNNRVSAMFATLPVGVADPVERLESIREQMAGLKESKQAVAGGVLTSLSGFAPAMLLALGMRTATRIPQRSVNTVTTNVPGPQFPLYAAGRRMLEAFPYVPLGGSVRVGVAIFSYNGGLTFGVTGDFDSAPDIGVLCRGIEAGLADLVDAAEASPARARGAGSKGGRAARSASARGRRAAGTGAQPRGEATRRQRNGGSRS
jgi:diacylglycerol O-acyltransferase / wax synthase